MAKTLNDILSLMNLYVGDFSPDSSDELTKKIQAINTAKDIILSQLGLPSSEKTFTINFLEDFEKYKLPVDFLEPISLEYDTTFNSDKNKSTDFIYLYPEEINKKDKLYDVVFWGIDLSDGIKKIYIKTKNSNRITTISGCDSLLGWTASDDASNLTIDNVRYITKSASIKFTINKTLSGNSRATLTFISPTSFDLSLFKDIGSFSIKLYIENSTGLNSITFKWGSDSLNYWYSTATTNFDGNSFESQKWNTIVFPWSSFYIGSPNVNNINFFQINIDYNESTFQSPQNWNIDNIIFFVFDKLILRYYSENVVFNSSTNSYKKDFENNNDIALFADSDASLINLVAQLAAYIYNPLINRDASGVPIIKEIFNTSLPNYILRFPKRTPIFYRGYIKGPELRWS